MSQRPRFRQDLIAELIDDTADAETRFIDVMNPDSGHVFRLYEVEYSLACAMDGERDVPGIVRWAKDELGLTASAREVELVISTLNEFGYLEPGTAAVALPVEPKRTAAPAEAVQAPSANVAQKQPRAPQPVAAVAPAPVAVAAPASSARAAVGPEVELGHAGPPPSAGDAPTVPAADIELGSGILVASQTQAAASPPVEDIALGHPGRAESARDSQMAREVDPRGDTAIELAASRPEERPTRHPTQPQPTPHLGQRAARPSDRPVQSATSEPQPSDLPVPPAAVASEPVAPPAAAASVESRASEPARPRTPSWRESRQLPAQRPEPEAPRPPAAPPEQPRVSRSVLALLAAAIVAAVAFVTYKIAVKKPDDHRAAPEVLPVPPPSQTPEPLPVEIQPLATTPELIENLKSSAPAVVEKVVEAAVARGDVVVELAGHKRVAAEIARLERDIEKRAQPDVAAALRERDAAQAAGAKAKLAAAEKRLADRQRSLDQKQAKLAAKKLELEKLELKAPAAGRVTSEVAPGTKVTPTDVIAKLTLTSKRTATFKTAGGHPSTRVFLISKASGRRLSCVVARVGAEGTTIECPLDVAPESTEVTYGGIDTTPPANEPEAPDHTEIQIDPVSPESAGAAGSASGASDDKPTSGAAPATRPEEPKPSVAPTAPTAPKTPTAPAASKEGEPSGVGETPTPPGNSPAPPSSAAEPAPPNAAEPPSGTPSAPASPAQ